MSDDLGRLSRKLRGTTLTDDLGTSLSRALYPKQVAALPEDLKVAALGLMEEICGIVPSDFDFSVIFEIEGISIMFELSDGNCGGDAGTEFFTSRKSMRQKLRRIDWEERRKEVLSGLDIFDEMLQEADDRPPNIPSSAAAAERFSKELKDALAEIEALDPKPCFAFVIGRADAGVAFEVFEERGGMMDTIADRMTTDNHVLAIVENGTKWGFPEIEAAKREAVERLLGLSRARAERRLSLRYDS